MRVSLEDKENLHFSHAKKLWLFHRTQNRQTVWLGKYWHQRNRDDKTGLASEPRPNACLPKKIQSEDKNVSEGKTLTFSDLQHASQAAIFLILWKLITPGLNYKLGEFIITYMYTRVELQTRGLYYTRVEWKLNKLINPRQMLRTN